MRSYPSLAAILLAIAAGCGGSETGLAAGEACTRTYECGPGLACIMGACNGDPSLIGGEVPMPGEDAGAEDMGEPVDLGDADLGPQPDLGPEEDMFAPDPDLGVEEDMFVPAEDMFVPEPDLGVEEDMFVPEPDLGTPDLGVDAG